MLHAWTGSSPDVLGGEPRDVDTVRVSIAQPTLPSARLVDEFRELRALTPDTKTMHFQIDASDLAQLPFAGKLRWLIEFPPAAESPAPHGHLFPDESDSCTQSFELSKRWGPCDMPIVGCQS